MIQNIYRHIAAIGITCMALQTSTVFAQEYPTKTVTMVVSYAAGGNNDIRARQLGVSVGAALGKSFIIDNKPGASGNIGHDVVARAAADGYTLGVGAMGPLAVNQAIFPKMQFDSLTAFAPVILIEKSPLVLVTRVEKPFRNLQDVITAAKAKPGALTIGNAGPGGAHHLSAEMFKQTAGIFMLSIPYKGGGPASTALLSGEIDLMFEQTTAALPNIQAGKIRPLAVTSAKRLPNLPDVPTMAELGYPKATISNWLGLIAPKGTPPAIISKLNDTFNKALVSSEMRDRITGLGNEIGGGSPEEFSAFIVAENKRWSALVKSAGIKLE